MQKGGERLSVLLLKSVSGVIIFNMKVDLTPYRDKKICVALSGGKDSMALVHCLLERGREYGITLSAVNCDHCIRGEESAMDSAFVANFCKERGIPLYFFCAEGLNLCDEKSARNWRLSCFDGVLREGKADFIATAHHMNDNAETVLFNIARGSSLAGATGIKAATSRGYIRPLIGVSRGEIDEYVARNNIPYVTDSTNLSDDYTRNRIRHGVIPLLEQAVPGAVKNIYRFSRLASEDEEYLCRIAASYVLPDREGYVIAPCKERVIYKRAVHSVVAVKFSKKDYTADQFERLFALSCAENGKAFNFLGLCAVKRPDGIKISPERSMGQTLPLPFYDALSEVQPYYYGGELACICQRGEKEKIIKALNGRVKVLEFDLGKIPESAVLRFRQSGDIFRKFGGGAKSLGDFLTDKKIPKDDRDSLPLIADGKNILAVGGVEISDGIKITDKTERAACFICRDASVK